MSTEANAPWTKAEFEQKLREKEKYYHIHHEFHLLMNSGKLEKTGDSGLGCQPLLLPDRHPGQRCRHHGQLPEQGCTPTLGTAHHRS